MTKKKKQDINIQSIDFALDIIDDINSICIDLKKIEICIKEEITCVIVETIHSRKGYDKHKVNFLNSYNSKEFLNFLIGARKRAIEQINKRLKNVEEFLGRVNLDEYKNE